MRTGVLRCAALIGMAACATAHPHTDDSECVDFFLDGKENACDDYIANVDVSLGSGSSCSTLFCEDGCKYANFCDKSCGFCTDTSPTSTPSLSPTAMPQTPTLKPSSSPTTPEAMAAAQAAAEEDAECFDKLVVELGVDEACDNFMEKIDDQYGEGSACEAFMCSDCQYAGTCDKTCAVCGPSAAPTAAPEFMDYGVDGLSEEESSGSSSSSKTSISSSLTAVDTSCENTLDSMGEGLCALYTANGVDCDDYFCEDCTYTGICDELCDFCVDVEEEDEVTNSDVCINQLDVNIGTGECAFYEESGYACDEFFCPTCAGKGYCDSFCGWCTADEDGTITWVGSLDER